MSCALGNRCARTIAFTVGMMRSWLPLVAATEMAGSCSCGIYTVGSACESYWETVGLSMPLPRVRPARCW
jgi:hypothetical protein